MTRTKRDLRNFILDHLSDANRPSLNDPLEDIAAWGQAITKALKDGEKYKYFANLTDRREWSSAIRNILDEKNQIPWLQWGRAWMPQTARYARWQENGQQPAGGIVTSEEFDKDMEDEVEAEAEEDGDVFEHPKTIEFMTTLPRKRKRSTTPEKSDESDERDAVSVNSKKIKSSPARAIGGYTENEGVPIAPSIVDSRLLEKVQVIVKARTADTIGNLQESIKMIDGHLEVHTKQLQDVLAMHQALSDTLAASVYEIKVLFKARKSHWEIHNDLLRRFDSLMAHNTDVHAEMPDDKFMDELQMIMQAQPADTVESHKICIKMINVRLERNKIELGGLFADHRAHSASLAAKAHELRIVSTARETLIKDREDLVNRLDSLMRQAV
ncbi:hypothetical protein BJ138DRAFT_1159490 [Hygrophoropsis aurantiaca]|uniref:Uncharacterized protein n=1 Tax=Hygrophoropsis aurantiaca TaxID=72124 RepID=A0ACB8A3B8_9AGAM|nr:hypothetical protein BJ138DRAFT_1159490 [Hygrophoropsis aurantiaca]